MGELYKDFLDDAQRLVDEFIAARIVPACVKCGASIHVLTETAAEICRTAEICTACGHREITQTKEYHGEE